MSIPSGFDKTNILHWLAFGFGAGFSPKAPGTVGTAVALLPYLLLANASILLYVVVVIAALLLGVWICGRTAEDLGVHDHGGIVWDEFVGLWIALFLVPLDVIWITCGFLLFRLLDIIKPWPIKWADKRVPGGWGIMLDDVLAGIMAALGIQAALAMTTL